MKIKLNQSIKYIDFQKVILLSWHINQYSLKQFSEIINIITINNTMRFIPQNNFIILSTCNRVEVYIYSANSQSILNEIITDVNAFTKNIFKEELNPHINYGINAIKHLIHVTGGLKSIAFGEYQIQGQVKSTYISAIKVQKICSQLISIFELALRLGKLIRSNTIIGHNKISLSSLAIDLLLQLNPPKNNTTILVVGTGKMAVLAVKYFVENGYNSFIFFSNNPKKEIKGIQGINYSILPISLLIKYFKTYKFTFIAISPNAPRVSINLKNKPKYSIIDLSIPQNFVNNNELKIINMEMLKKINPYTIISLKTCLMKCEKIINIELTNIINKNNFRINLNNYVNNTN